MIQRTGRAAKLPFPVHPHMLRHSTEYKLANDVHDTRSLAHYLGHRNLQSTARGAGSLRQVLKRLAGSMTVSSEPKQGPRPITEGVNLG